MIAFLNGCTSVVKRFPIHVIFREYFEGIFAAIFLAIFLRFFVVSVLYMPTNSMEPGLKKGDFVIGWKLSYGLVVPLSKGERLNFKAPQKGEVISFRFPGDEEQILVRRVIGVPGDKIKIENERVYVNGSPISEGSTEAARLTNESVGGKNVTYKVRAGGRTELAELEVPKGQYFVLSDNRPHNDDSRDWGMVPLQNIESRLGFIWFSLKRDKPELEIRWDRIFMGVR